jgi:hypothetical protein
MIDSSANTKSQPIDLIIPWVDGNDPQLTAKRKQFVKSDITSRYSGAHPTRFASSNEIRYCVLSILKFAPFVRTIYILTDNQDPDVYGEVKKYFPERLNAIKIVDHKHIFRDYEEYLPTFNSISIGNMAWRIENLSENFVYFNDDVFLIRSITPEDWIVDGRPVLRGRWRIAPFVKIAKRKIKGIIQAKILHNPNYQPKFSFYIVQWNAARVLGMWYKFFFNCHTPHVMNRKRIEAFYNDNTDLLKKNIWFRFRNQSQFNVTTLSNHLELLSGNRNAAKLNLGYLVPSIYSPKKLNRKMRRIDNEERVKSVCIQSLDTASPQTQDKMFKWMDKILDLEPAS